MLLKKFCIRIPRLQEQQSRSLPRNGTGQGSKTKTPEFQAATKGNLTRQQHSHFFSRIKLVDHLTGHSQLQSYATNLLIAPTLERIGRRTQLDIKCSTTVHAKHWARPGITDDVQKAREFSPDALKSETTLSPWDTAGLKQERGVIRAI